MKLHGIETERKSTEEHLRIQTEVMPIIQGMFQTEIKTVKYYHNKDNHGDCDLLVLNDGTLGNVPERLRERFGVIHSNNGVYSFAYDNYQVDIILQDESIWDCCQDFFDYDPTGNLMGKIANFFGLKYGNKGLHYCYRNEGRVSRNIYISNDSKRNFEFLGYDYDRYLQGFDTVEEIFDWIVAGKYFAVECFRLENLNHSDRNRNKKRATFQGFLKYLDDKNIQSTFKFEDESTYLKLIQDFFPEGNLKEKIEEFDELDRKSQNVYNVFNGNMVMELTGLEGKVLGNAISSYKTYVSETYKQTFIDFTNEYEGNIMENFKEWYHGL